MSKRWIGAARLLKPGPAHVEAKTYNQHHFSTSSKHRHPEKILPSPTMPINPVNFFQSDDSTTPTSRPDSRIDQAIAVKYWSDKPATVNGMLGGYAQVSRTDLRGSRNFLAKARRLIPGCPVTGKLKRGVDCGAGIGRVINDFLGQECQVVDAVEPVEKFSRVLSERRLTRNSVLGEVLTIGIEDWVPAPKVYDLIWAQWSVPYLTDAQLVEYLVRCRGALTDVGIIVIKENISEEPEGDIYDEEESSVTRTDEKLRRLFKEAGMHLILSELQTGFPRQLRLLPVRSYALRPKS
ncbi:AdoMet dependent proline di-methyltransferase-domain-containing protein [Aspergillus bertholletiae]|uniref:Alpha N-terminal protein methyltransferase 1 n=1 Tax=Aspergillus bertholletiae TaxID=1226010 RepID=A0A5N7BIM8_9EURO|nr:AdoMet dependent proline di-methyltransferase-domain-containing protein [Aspergillus bertholletiae]